jgi:tetratricopeptide (TPR) repeat protein
MASLTEALAIAQRHYQARRWEAAEQVCQQILQTTPDQQDALELLEQIAAQQQYLEQAIAQCRQLLTLQSNNPDVYNQLGVLLRQQGKLEEAIAHYQQALALKPDYAEVHNNLGNVLRSLGNVEDAIAHFQQAIALQPDHAAAYTNLGLALQEQGKFRAAMQCHIQAVSLQPDFAEAHFNLSLTLLTLGEYQRGFAEYEWRWRRPNRSPRLFTQPLWDGSDLTGKTILLHAEQGLGDTLQFIRYAPLVAERGGRIIVECQASLLRLLQAVPEIAVLIPRDAPLPDFDVHAPLMSLPRILGTTVTTIPAPVPY